MFAALKSPCALTAVLIVCAGCSNSAERQISAVPLTATGAPSPTVGHVSNSIELDAGYFVPANEGLASAAPVSLIQSESGVSIASSANFQTIKLVPATYSGTTHSARTDELGFVEPMTDYDALALPALSTGPKQMVAGIARTVEYRAPISQSLFEKKN